MSFGQDFAPTLAAARRGDQRALADLYPREHGRRIDIHCDETDDPARATSR
jgi:cytosine/adenosine deaminase-related metal-dependent hydrolase